MPAFFDGKPVPGADNLLADLRVIDNVLTLRVVKNNCEPFVMVLVEGVTGPATWNGCIEIVGFKSARLPSAGHYGQLGERTELLRSVWAKLGFPPLPRRKHEDERIH